MSAARRIERLRARNPAAAELALACALAARVEPDLLRRLRLLIPDADATAEADLWFSDLLAGRDATAIALDPLVADVLRAELRRPERTVLRDAAGAEIALAHADAHWSVRLEERIHHLDTATDTDATDAEIDELLLAALDRLNTEPEPRGTARWLLGVAGRLPRQVAGRAAGRASTAAAGLHLDRQAPPAGLLTATESETWLPWLAAALPTVAVPVRLVDGAVQLGADHSDAVVLPEVPDTDPLVIEVRWNDGTRAAGQRVRFRLGDAVHVETGTRAVSLVTLTGTTYDLSVGDEVTDPAAGLNFDHLKAKLRPCLAREKEQDLLLRQLLSGRRTSAPPWSGVTGRRGSGMDTVLVAVTDALRAEGIAVVEHFFTGSSRLDHPEVVRRSILAQLASLYPTLAVQVDVADVGSAGLDEASGADIGPMLGEFARLGAFDGRPLVIALAGVRADPDGGSPLSPLRLPEVAPPGVRCLVSTDDYWSIIARYLGPRDPVEPVVLTGESDRRVCLAMVERERAILDRAFAGRITGEAVADLADNLPGNVAAIQRWAALRPPGTASLESVPAIFTVRWPSLRADWVKQFGEDRTVMLLDVVRAVDGRHTRLDVGSMGALIDGRWGQFWSMLRASNLIEDARPDELMRLAEPSIAERLRHLEGLGDRVLGLAGVDLDRSVRQLSRTRLASAVFHALELKDIDTAVALCTNVTVLRRRYAEDVTGLLDDLAAVEATDGTPPTIPTLRTAIRGLAAEGVPPSAFAPALHDRLIELCGTPVWLADDPAALAPLRVRQVLDDSDLRVSSSSGPAGHPGPVLAMLPLSTGYGEPMLITPAGLTSMAAPPDSGSTDGLGLVGAVRGLRGGCVAWSTDTLHAGEYVELSSHELDVRLAPVGPLDTHVDHAAALLDAVAVAAPDGGVTVWPLPRRNGREKEGGAVYAIEPQRPWRMPGRGARVTALTQPVPGTAASPGEPRTVLAASEDGVVRLLTAPDRPPTVFAGHRGAVRCLVAGDSSTFFSGGDDGCVLRWRYDDPSRPMTRWQVGDSPVTRLGFLFDGRWVVAGTAAGEVSARRMARGEFVEQRDFTAEYFVLGGHTSAVRGITTFGRSVVDAGRGEIIVTWADSVRFWLSPSSGRSLLGEATGFPGGVRDVIVERDRYYVLCGDGSVQSRLMPDLSAPEPDNHPEYGCLAVDGSTVYFGQDNNLVGHTPDGPNQRLATDGPYTHAGVTRGGPVVRNVAGAVSGLAQDASSVSTADDLAGVDILATDGRDMVVTAADQLIGFQVGAGLRYSLSPYDTASAPVTSLAVRPPDDSQAEQRMQTFSRPRPQLVIAGLANGDVQVVDIHDQFRARTLPGDGVPITAVAGLADGSVLSGSAEGDFRWWPGDPTHGPTTFPRRAGAITGVVAAEPWVVSAGRDGRIVLWATDPVRPVHEITIGSPVVALAAEPGQVAARDERGRLWLLDLDDPGEQDGFELAPIWYPATDRTISLDIHHRGPGGGAVGLAAVSVRLDGVRLPVTSRDRWPSLDPDGHFIEPARPQPDLPVRLAVETPPGWDGSPDLTVDLTLLSRRLPGYRTLVSHSTFRADQEPSGPNS